MSFDHIISVIYNLLNGEVILICDSTILLDYEHKFMVCLHAMDSRS